MNNYETDGWTGNLVFLLCSNFNFTIFFNEMVIALVTEIININSYFSFNNIFGILNIMAD